MNPPSWNTPNAALVRDELLRRVEQQTAPDGAPSAAARRTPDRLRSVWVTAAVGFVVLALVVAVLNAVHVRGGDAAPAGGGLTEESMRLLEQVPQPDGRIVHTWTQDASAGGSESFRVGERTAVLGGACTGGGSIEVVDQNGGRHALNCASTAALQPVWQTAATGGGAPVVAAGPVTIRVRVTAGSPRYVVRLWAVDPSTLPTEFAVAPTSSVVPASLRDCTSGDLAQGASFATPDAFQRGLVTLTNTSGTDCAVRAWPSLRPVDAAGNLIGPAPAFGEARSLDGAEGDAGSSGRFPPARIAAGGHGYFITDLSTLGDLQQQDQQARADAEGEPGTAAYVASADRTVSCGAARVAALRLTVGSAVLTVPLAGRLMGACQDVAQDLDVNPVVSTRPQG